MLSFSVTLPRDWRKHMVMVKVLTETTLCEVFLHEIGIWKSLNHLNMLRLFSAHKIS